jgi:alpha-L-fucosidase
MVDNGQMTPDWSRFERPVPDWYRDAKLGIFIHWGPYSVPAWAEPTGELGAVDEATWFRHNPYAEWYANTIRFADSPARAHHAATHGDAPYDDFLDAWRAQDFDPTDWAALFARTGARYVVPTTKHHDGVTLWDAPGTGGRNTVRRGPRRDLVADLEAAVRGAGMRFGVYYSGGLDWHVSDFPPLDSHTAVSDTGRPKDAAYAAYAHLHVRDLVDRFRPDVLWNDIEWPDAGKHAGSLGLAELFDHYYETVPDGVVNDRWGDTHRDYRTSEYQHGLDNETAQAWENCRGLGLSFGYNRVEDEAHTLDGPAVVRHLVDVVSRGGNLLLDVGPTAEGTIPDVQRRSLDALAAWMKVNAGAIHGSRPLDDAVAAPSDAPWVRWTQRDDSAYAIVAGGGRVTLDASPERLDTEAAAVLGGRPVPAKSQDRSVVVDLPEPPSGAPTVVRFPLRGGR